MNKKKLLIIGGMGAFAGVEMARHLVLSAQHHGAVMDSDFPEFELYNLPAEGMDETGVKDDIVLRKQVNDLLLSKNTSGFDYGIIACNSAHCFLDEFQSNFSGRFVSLIQAGVRSVGKRKETVGLMTSESSRRSRIYQSALESAGKNHITATDDEQKLLNQIILHCITGRHNERDRRDIADIVLAMTRRGAQQILLGCTELPMVAENHRLDIEFVNPYRAAADELVELMK